MSLEQAILEAVQTLPPDKQREVYEHAARLRADNTKRPPFKSVRGLWADPGISLSAQELDENQHVAGLPARRSVMPGVVVDTHTIVWYLAPSANGSGTPACAPI